MNVSLHTLRGSIELTALDGDLEASTNDGALAIEVSDGRPLVTAKGSITFTEDARRGSGLVGSKLAVYDGNVQLWAKDGESVIVDGRSLLSPTTNLEIARSEGGETRAVTVGEPAEGTMLVEISRGSVNLSRWNPRRAPALSDR